MLLICYRLVTEGSKIIVCFKIIFWAAYYEVKIILGLLFLACEIHLSPLLTWILSCTFVGSNKSYILCQRVSDILPGDENSKTNNVWGRSCLYGASNLIKAEPFSTTGDKGDGRNGVVDFSKYVLSACSVPGTATGVRDRGRGRGAFNSLMVGSSRWEECYQLSYPALCWHSWTVHAQELEVRSMSVNGSVWCAGEWWWQRGRGAVFYGLWHQQCLGWKLPVPILLNVWIWLNDERLAMKSRQAAMAQTKQTRNLPRVLLQTPHSLFHFFCPVLVIKGIFLFYFVYVMFLHGLSVPAATCTMFQGENEENWGSWKYEEL